MFGNRCPLTLLPDRSLDPACAPRGRARSSRAPRCAMPPPAAGFSQRVTVGPTVASTTFAAMPKARASLDERRVALISDDRRPCRGPLSPEGRAAKGPFLSALAEHAGRYLACGRLDRGLPAAAGTGGEGWLIFRAWRLRPPWAALGQAEERPDGSFRRAAAAASSSSPRSVAVPPGRLTPAGGAPRPPPAMPAARPARCGSRDDHSHEQQREERDRPTHFAESARREPRQRRPELSAGAVAGRRVAALAVLIARAARCTR
jgi:hypothetical protein